MTSAIAIAQYLASKQVVFDAVFAHYGRINGSSLSRMTHTESPRRDT